MGKKLTESKVVNILLAILIAVALWIYVTTMVNPNDGSLNVRDIPITLVGEDILAGKGLMIDPGTDLTMDLTLVGNRNAAANIASSGSILITVDVSGIDAAKEYTLPCKITLPNTVTTGTASVQNGIGKTVRLTVSKMLTKSVELRGKFEGTVPDGYRTNDFTISPSTLNLQGPESLINQIEYAQVTVSGENLSQTFRGDLGFEYITSQGAVLQNPKIVSNVDTVSVILPVVKTMEIPLEVEFTPGGGATMDDVSYEISPKTIQISGEETDIARLQDRAITLGVIDLSKVEETETITFPILLPTELTNDSGVSEATVTIQVKGLSTKVLNVTDIQVINAPEGRTVTPVTQSLQVRVRGSAEALDAVSDYQLQAVCDLAGQSLSPGQFVFDAKIYLSGDGKSGVVGKKYSIVVSVQ